VTRRIDLLYFVNGKDSVNRIEAGRKMRVLPGVKKPYDAGTGVIGVGALMAKVG